MEREKKSIVYKINCIFLVILLISILIFNVFSAKIINKDILIIISFFINFIITIYFILKDQYSYSLNKTFWYFSFFFFVLAPFLQYLSNSHLWDFYILDKYYLIGNIYIFIWLILYSIFYDFIKNKNLKNDKKIEISKVFYKKELLLLFFVLSIICFLYVINKITFMGLFNRMTNNLTFKSNAIKTIITSLLRAIPVYSLLYTILYVRNNKKNKKIIYIILMILFIITFCLNYPLSITRYWVGVVYIGLFLILFKKYIKRKTFDYLLIFSLALIFPLFQIFKWHGTEALKDFNLIKSRFSTTYNNVDFDSYSMFLRGIIYVEDNSITYGKQSLSTLFFYIPRSIWESKPHHSGQFVSSAQGQEYTNLSFPLIAEGYLDYGYLGSILYVLILAYILAKLDYIFWNENDDKSFINYIYPFSIGILIFLLRGSMQPVVVYTFSFYLFSLVIFCFSTKGNNIINSMWRKLWKK